MRSRKEAEQKGFRRGYEEGGIWMEAKKKGRRT